MGRKTAFHIKRLELGFFPFQMVFVISGSTKSFFFGRSVHGRPDPARGFLAAQLPFLRILAEAHPTEPLNRLFKTK